MINSALLPIMRNILLLQFLFEGRLTVLEIRDIDADLVCRDFFFQ